MRIIKSAQAEMIHNHHPHHDPMDEVPQEDFMGDAPTHEDHDDGAEAINGDIMAEHHVGHEDHDDAGFGDGIDGVSTDGVGDAVDINPGGDGMLDVEVDGMPQDDLGNHTEPTTEGLDGIQQDDMSHDSDTGSSDMMNFGDDFSFDLEPMDNGGIEIELDPESLSPDQENDVTDHGMIDDTDGIEFNPDQTIEPNHGDMHEDVGDVHGDTEGQLNDYAEVPEHHQHAHHNQFGN